MAISTAPAYCTSGTGIHTPTQWATCAKLGWNQPTTGAARAGAFVGHNVMPIVILAVIVVVVIALAKSGGRSPATQRS